MSMILFLSPVDMAMAVGLAQVQNQSGSITMSLGFSPTQAGHSCSGARGYWAGPATTLKVSLWSAGTRLTSQNVAVSGPGVFTVTFGAAVAMTAGVPYAISVWDTAGLNYTTMLINSGSTLYFVLPAVEAGANVVAGQYIEYCTYSGSGTPYSDQGSGDVEPTSFNPFYGSPIEPTVT
jgi:hypothetical protein